MAPASIVISVLSLTAPLIVFLRCPSVLRFLFALLNPRLLLMLLFLIFLLLLLLLPLVILLLLLMLPLIILTWTSRRRRFLSSPLGRCGRSMFYLLLFKVLLDSLVPRLVTVTLAAQLMLLLYLSWIAVSRVLPLVGGQRGARWN